MSGQIIYRLFASTLIFAFVAACDARPKSQIDGAGFLDELLEDGPNVGGVSDALLSTAIQAEEAKNYGRALQYYQQLVDKYPDNMQYRLKLADNFRRLGKNDEAIQIYNGVLRRQPNNIIALEGRGLAHISKGDFSSASQNLEQVMAMDPNRWRTLNGVGLLFVAKNMPNEAVAYFDSALQRVPDHPTVLNNVGLTLALNGDFDRSVAALNRASGQVKSKSEQRRKIDLNLALVLGLSGDMERAEQVASRHLSKIALQNNLGFYARLAGDEKLAKAYLNSALSNSPTFYERAWKNLEQIK